MNMKFQAYRYRRDGVDAVRMCTRPLGFQGPIFSSALLHSSFKTFSFLKPILPISVEIDILTLSI